MQSRLSSADPKADGAKLTFLARKTELQVEKSWLVINCVQRLDLLIGQPACQVLYIHSDLPMNSVTLVVCAGRGTFGPACASQKEHLKAFASSMAFSDAMPCFNRRTYLD